jgi:hypothetical protein
VVFRLAKESKDYWETGKISPANFALSTPDKESELKALSVWANRLTTPQQARELVEADQASYRLAAYLGVAEVRALRPSPDSPKVPYLDVVWERLVIDQANSCPINVRERKAMQV